MLSRCRAVPAVLCPALSCRYYSIFTLGMLVMFECTVVVQRQRNLRELRSLQTPKQRLQVYRAGKWEVRWLVAATIFCWYTIAPIAPTTPLNNQDSLLVCGTAALVS